ncbi:MAG: hypothetical protein JEZ09_14720 [Salinivirgaceae bacterium]|nr:hypothetical protein [Salinivirgaceae bacterium]
MKKQIILFTFLLLTAFTINATVITVDNNPDGGAQYTDLQAAVDAASPGDTILVAGSATSYGNVSFNRQLVLIGAGYNNPYGENTIINNVELNRLNSSLSASGSVIMGFIVRAISLNGPFNGGDETTQSINDVILNRCKVEYIQFLYGGVTYSNNIITNCIIVENINIHAYSPSICQISGIQITNNIFNNAYITSGLPTEGYSTIEIKNNLFINRTSNVFASTIGEVIIKNNIFYAAEPLGPTGATYNNNLTYMCNDNTIPGEGNVGSGNLINQDPKFENYPLEGAAFSYDYDFHLKTGSPAIDSGTDGTDLGIYGGSNPFDVGANPPFPIMTEISFPDNQSSVPVGGTLNVNFKATKQD